MIISRQQTIPVNLVRVGSHAALTGNITDAVGLAAAIEYLLKIGIDTIARYEHDLLVYAMAALNRLLRDRQDSTSPRRRLNRSPSRIERADFLSHDRLWTL
jgi:selenocysteine lyase/cysteine desulfurase